MLSPAFLKRYKDADPPWGEVGYVTYKRTYARLIEGEGRTEEWAETCARAVNSLVKIGGIFYQPELERIYDMFFRLQGLPSGRALWQLGTKTVETVGSDSMQSCWHVAVNNIEAFCFTFSQLMLGGGVGFNVLPEYVYELPVVLGSVEITRTDEYDCDFIVPDNRQGWVDLLRRVLTCFFITGEDFAYCTRAIRAQGTPIKTFGGTASGSEPLVLGISQIVSILKSRSGKKLRPIDCLDIQNIIASVVVSGNVRRSAEIGVGSPDDFDFANAKDWTMHSIPNWRGLSNNSFMVSDLSRLNQLYWDRFAGEGEVYGLINPTLCREYGRLADGPGYRTDPLFVGPNPCGEISLENKEPCNLAEIFFPNIENEDEFREVALLLYKVAKTVSCLPFSDKQTQAVVTRNHRIGIGITGFVECPHLQDAGMFDRVYRAIELEDLRYSEKLDVKESRKLTTVKPSGTMSLLAGVTPGAHNGYSEYVIRRIRFSHTDPIVNTCREHGYHVEPVYNSDGSQDLRTVVVEFPMRYAEGIPTDQEPNAVEQLERQKWLQTHWSDNSVSLTAYYRPAEVPAIKTWLEANYTDSVKCTSFLRHVGHGFRQAPFEPISGDEYWELVASTAPVDRVLDTEELTFVDNLECSGGACPAR